MLIWILLSYLLMVNGFSYNLMFTNFDQRHLDKNNLEKLERMFYLKNSRYNPMKNQIYERWINGTNGDAEINITSILEKINNEFINSYKEEEEFEQNNDDNSNIDSQRRLNPHGYLDPLGVFRYYQKKQQTPQIVIG